MHISFEDRIKIWKGFYHLIEEETEGIRNDCNSTQTCTNNTCIDNQLVLTGLTGLHFTQEEVVIWRARAQNGPFRSSGDFSSNSPAIWNHILESANRAVANSANDRYTGYWTGPGCMPVGYPGWGTDMYPYEPRPYAGGSADSVQDAGFAYLITENENYASAVRTELLWYANNPNLDFSNRTRWCDNAMDNVNPGFFIASWLLRMLHAYDYTKDSSVYSQADHALIRDWLHEAGIYMDFIYTDTMEGYFPNRINYDYRQVTSGAIENVRGILWDNGPTIYSISDLFNNRRSNIAEFAFIAGVFFEDQELIENGIRFFKEAVAYSYIDGSPNDMFRGTSTNPSLGWSYSSIQINSLVHMADVYARHYSTSLYDFNTRDYQNVYYPSELSNRIWYNSVKSEKSLKTMIDTHLKYIDDTHNPQRLRGGYPISGYSNVGGNVVNKYYDSWLSQANVYYKDENTRSIYLRIKTGTRAFVSNPSGTGSWSYSWGGHANVMPGTLFMFGDMEGEVWPYK